MDIQNQTPNDGISRIEYSSARGLSREQVYLQHDETIQIKCKLKLNYILPLVEGERPVFLEHGGGAVEDALVSVLGGVHEARLDDVDGRRYDGGTEPSTERRDEVTRKVVGQEFVLEDGLFDKIVGNQFGCVNNRHSGDVR